MVDPLIQDLVKMKASISLGIIDLSAERAEVVRRLNKAGLPVIAWLLLEKDQGYWFNLDNARLAFTRYRDFKLWTDRFKLHWARIGVDIEPDIQELVRLTQKNWAGIPRIIARIFDHRRLCQGRREYLELVERIHSDGYLVDGYQFPVIADERKAGSSILQRAAGLVDIPVDREVWMLYSSFRRSLGAGLVASYSPEAQSIAVGSTGGGVDIGSGELALLTWEELSRDLRLGWHWCDDLHIFSLEGCVRQNFITRLASFEWDYPFLLPELSTRKVDRLRCALQASLWVGSRVKGIILAGMLAIIAGKRITILRKDSHRTNV